jgi:hypothetical protein
VEIELSKRQKVAAVSVLVFLGLALSDGYIVVHEAGHSATCALQGGEPEFQELDTGPAVSCLDVDDTWNQWNLGLFFIGGVLAEAALAATLLIHPLTRILGGLSVFKIFGTLLFTQGYSHDLTQLVEVAIL